MPAKALNANSPRVKPWSASCILQTAADRRRENRSCLKIIKSLSLDLISGRRKACIRSVKHREKYGRKTAEKRYKIRRENRAEQSRRPPYPEERRRRFLSRKKSQNAQAVLREKREVVCGFSERRRADKGIEGNKGRKRPDCLRRNFKTFKRTESFQCFKNIKRSQSYQKSQNYGVRQVRLRQGSRAHGLRLCAGSESTGSFRSGNARKIAEDTTVLRSERKVLGKIRETGGTVGNIYSVFEINIVWVNHCCILFTNSSKDTHLFGGIILFIQFVEFLDFKIGFFIYT